MLWRINLQQEFHRIWLCLLPCMSWRWRQPGSPKTPQAHYSSCRRPIMWKI